PAKGPGGGKAAPESPACPFEHALPVCIMLPPVVAVELITVAFDREPRVPAPFNNQIDAIRAGLDLWDYTIAARDELSVHLSLELGFAALHETLYLVRLGRQRPVKMSQQAGADVPLRQVGGSHRAHQVHSVPGPAGRDVEALLEHEARDRPAISRVDDHGQEDDVAVAALEITRIAALKAPAQQLGCVTPPADHGIDVVCLLVPQQGYHTDSTSGVAPIRNERFDFRCDRLSLHVIPVPFVALTLRDMDVYQRRVETLG